jgi:hypothetical protein
MLKAFAIVLIACLTVTVGSFGRISSSKTIDYSARIGIIALGLIILYAPVKAFAPLLALIAVAIIFVGFRQTKKISAAEV